MRAPKSHMSRIVYNNALLHGLLWPLPNRQFRQRTGLPSSACGLVEM